MSLPKASVFLIVSGVFALAGLLAACGSEEAARPQGGAAPVTVVTLSPTTVTLQRELPGRAVPFKVAEVRPQVSGIIAKRLFTEGTVVEAGQPLYQLDDARYRADYESAKAALARAQAGLNSARLYAERAAELIRINAISKQDNDNAVAALKEAEADVAEARAAVNSAQVTLDYARIVAPISGGIGRSAVTQGALVTAGQDALLTKIQQYDPIYVDVTQSSAELLELRKELAAGRIEDAADLPVNIVLEDGSLYEHQGRLAFAELTVDPSTGQYVSRVVVPNPDYLLLPGMYVRAVISTGIRANALLVPQQGIARNSKGETTAMVVDAAGNAELRPVVVSRTIDDKWLVDSGLSAGDRVIVEGLQKVRPGAPVQATEAGTAAPAPPPAARAPG
jgi:membrane fusion protein, multidrug efflux system